MCNISVVCLWLYEDVSLSVKYLIMFVSLHWSSFVSVVMERARHQCLLLKQSIEYFVSQNYTCICVS